MFIYDQISGTLMLGHAVFAGFSPLAPSPDMQGDWTLTAIDDGDVISLERIGGALANDPPSPAITRPSSDYVDCGGIVFSREARKAIWETEERDLRIICGWEEAAPEEIEA